MPGATFLEWRSHLILGSAQVAAVGHRLNIELEHTSNGGATGGWALIDAMSLMLSGGPDDVDSDRFVELDDYIIIRDHFRTPVTTLEMGNLNFDVTFNFVVFIEWRKNASGPAMAAFAALGAKCSRAGGGVPCGRRSHAAGECASPKKGRFQIQTRQLAAE